MQVSLYIFLWLLFLSLTKHIDECSHWLIATPIACFTSVLSTLISVNIDQPKNISWCALTTALFDPSNVGWRDSRHVTGQIPAWTFNQSLILYWLDGWMTVLQSNKNYMQSPEQMLKDYRYILLPAVFFLIGFLFTNCTCHITPASRHNNTAWLTLEGRKESWTRGQQTCRLYGRLYVYLEGH